MKMTNKPLLEQVEELFDEQLRCWHTAKVNYTALDTIQSKSLHVGGLSIAVQFNPSRIASSAAKVDNASISRRKCFLCEQNRPVEQRGIEYGDYTILINPFPIFTRHLTIPCKKHTPQVIEGRLMDMLKLAKDLSGGFTLFYNGAKCGASAPDHFHFQACPRGVLPVEREVTKGNMLDIFDDGVGAVRYLSSLPFVCLCLSSKDPQEIQRLFVKVCVALKKDDDEAEPRINLICFSDDTHLLHLLVIPRTNHRPSCYFKERDEALLISPASVDFGGIFITPREADFLKVTSSDIEQIVRECAIQRDNIQNIRQSLK